MILGVDPNRRIMFANCMFCYIGRRANGANGNLQEGCIFGLPGGGSMPFAWQSLRLQPYSKSERMTFSFFVFQNECLFETM
jgi:hypothetical protein